MMQMLLNVKMLVPSIRRGEEMEKWQGAELNKAKEILGYELTKLVHGEEEAKKALDAAKNIFAKEEFQVIFLQHAKAELEQELIF